MIAAPGVGAMARLFPHPLDRGMIGSLLYLTASRPDIMFSVCLCARFQEDPKVSHLEAVKRIFRINAGRCSDRKKHRSSLHSSSNVEEIERGSVSLLLQLSKPITFFFGSGTSFAEFHLSEWMLLDYLVHWLNEPQVSKRLVRKSLIF
ncbi:hypothetical protein Tco_0210954 [Tanacetum coccineum]